MSRHKSARKRKGSSGLRFKLVLLLLIAGVAGWLGITAVRGARVVKPLLPSASHAFISQKEAEAPVFLLAQQGQRPGALDKLIILKIDEANRKVIALQLPTNLSDGQTLVGEYLESRFYKEMQLAIEQQLAMPITNYIIQPRADLNPGKSSLMQSLSFHPSPSWWNTTAGLPLWLDQLNTIRTDLPSWRLLQICWLIRDLQLDQTDIAQLDPPTTQAADEGVTLVADRIDQVIQEKFVDPEIRRDAVSVVVKNATNVSGLASLTSRFIANMGGEIVAVEPADTAQTNSSQTAEKESGLSRSITQFLGIPLTKQARTGRERADVELIIGTDALVRLGK